LSLEYALCKGNKPSSRPTRKSVSNSNPFAECTVIRFTASLFVSSADVINVVLPRKSVKFASLLFSTNCVAAFINS